MKAEIPISPVVRPIPLIAQNIFLFNLFVLAAVVPLIFSFLTKDPFIIKEFVFVACAMCALAFYPLVVSGYDLQVLKSKHGVLLMVSAGYLAATLASGMFAVNRPLVGEVLLIQGLYLSTIFVTAVLSERESKRFIVWAACACAVTILYGFLQKFHMDPVVWLTGFGGRPGSTLGNPNFFAGYLIVLIPVFLAAGLEAKRTIHKVLWFALTSGAVADLFFTQTRGAWLACAGSLVLFLVLYGVMREKLLLTLVLAVVVSASLCGLFLDKLVPLYRADTQSVVERVFKWKTAYAMIKEHPLVGVGAGNLKVNYALYQAKIRKEAGFALRGTSESNVHNEYLQIWAEQGTVALACFLALFAYYFYMVFKLARRQTSFLVAGYAAGVAAFLIFSLSNFPLRIIPTAVVVFALFGLTVSMYNREADTSLPVAAKEEKGPRIFFCVVMAGSLGVLLWWIIPGLRAEILRQKADTAFAERDFSGAVRAYEKAIALDHSHSERTAYDLGEVYRSLGRYDDALRAYMISVSLRNYGEVYHDIGNCYYIKKDIPRTLRYWRLAYELGLPSEQDQENLKKNIGIVEQIKQP
jgi:O-antigen ligase